MRTTQLKQAVKECLLYIGGESLVNLYWKARGNKEIDYFLAGGRGQRFSRIYEKNAWVSGIAGAPSSGPGSSLAATGSLRIELPELLDELGASSLVDIGCGDMTWMSEVEMRQTYIGLDIVPEVIAANRARVGSVSRRFEVLDVCEEVPPRADAALCREILFHLSFEDGKQALRNIGRSGATFLLATSDPTIRRNANILTGEFREINLAIAPYDLGPPLKTIRDSNGQNRNRILGVWRL